MRRATAVTLMALVLTAAWGQTAPPLVVRHGHFFVIVNDGAGLPTVTAQSRSFHTYSDDLKVQVIDDKSNVVLQRAVALGGQLQQQIPGAPAFLYLVLADPGMNGVVLDCDRPWGVVAAGSYGLGSSGKTPVLYLYVPPECERVTVKVQASSPREGLRLVVTDSSGAELLVIDGEADTPVQEQIAVPAAERGKVWALTLSDPQTCDARLDDIQLWVDGYLAPLLWPRAEWAAQHGPLVWQRHKAVLDAH